MSLQRWTTYHLIHTQQFTGFGAEGRSMYCVPGSRRSGVRALPYSSIAWRLKSCAHLWPISPVLFTHGFLPGSKHACPKGRLSKGMDSFTAATSDPPHPVMATAYAFLQVSPFPMLNALHAGLDPQLIHLAKHPGRVNPSYTCKHVLAGGLFLLQRSHW